MIFAKVTFFLFCLLYLTCTLSYSKTCYKTYKIILYSIFYLLKSFSVSRASSPWPRRSKCRSSMSRAMIFSKSWFKACLTKKNSCESFHNKWFQPLHFWSEVKHHNCWSTINKRTIRNLWEMKPLWTTEADTSRNIKLHSVCVYLTWLECVTIRVRWSGKLW